MATDNSAVSGNASSGGTWTTYTPTFTGFGTLVSQFVQYLVDGNDLLVRAQFVSGTTTTTEARMSLPTGRTSAATIVTIAFTGMAERSDPGGTYHNTVLIETSKTYLTFGQNDGGNSGLTKRNADDMGTDQTWSFTARIPLA